MLWKPMRHLMAKAKAIRAKQGPPRTATSTQPREMKPDQFSPGSYLANAGEIMDIDLSGVFSPQSSEQSGGSWSGILSARSMTMPQANISDPQMADFTMSPDMGDVNNQDFLNWNGWTPAVGDFNVAPEPIVQYFQNIQQEWF